MKKTEYTVSNKEQLLQFFKDAEDAFDANGTQRYTIRNAKESLSELQRGYYWIIVTVCAEHNALTKEEQHLHFKEAYLLNIYLGDPENHPEFEELKKSMLVVRDLAPEQYPTIRKFVIDNISHLTATRDNMADLIKECINYGWDHKISIPPPKRKEVCERSKEE